MRLGLSSYVHRWSIGARGFTPSRPMTTREFVERAIRSGVMGVQVCDHLEFLEQPEGGLRSIRRLAERHGLFVETGAKSAEPRHLARVLAASEALGARLMRVVPEIAPGGDPAARHREIGRVVGGLKEILPIARAFGIRIAVENHGQIPSAELCDLVRAVDDPSVGVCLDTMNSVVLLEHPLSTARILAPLAISVHLKDFLVEAAPRGHRILGVPLGAGLVDCREVMVMLREAGHDPNVHIELYIDRKAREAETLAWEEECIVRSIRYARETLGL